MTRLKLGQNQAADTKQYDVSGSYEKRLASDIANIMPKDTQLDGLALSTNYEDTITLTLTNSVFKRSNGHMIYQVQPRLMKLIRQHLKSLGFSWKTKETRKDKLVNGVASDVIRVVFLLQHNTKPLDMESALEAYIDQIRKFAESEVDFNGASNDFQEVVAQHKQRALKLRQHAAALMASINAQSLSEEEFADAVLNAGVFEEGGVYPSDALNFSGEVAKALEKLETQLATDDSTFCGEYYQGGPVTDGD